MSHQRWQRLQSGVDRLSIIPSAPGRTDAGVLWRGQSSLFLTCTSNPLLARICLQRRATLLRRLVNREVSAPREQRRSVLFPSPHRTGAALAHSVLRSVRTMNSSAQTPHYVYEPPQRTLDTGLRLLRVLHTRLEGRIQVELRQSLSATEYRCLSYRWGEPSEDHQVPARPT